MSFTINPADAFVVIVAIAAVAIVALVYGWKPQVGATEKGIELETDSG